MSTKRDWAFARLDHFQALAAPETLSLSDKVRGVVAAAAYVAALALCDAIERLL